MAAQEAVQGLHNPAYVKNEANGYDYGYGGGYGQLYNPYMHYGEQQYEQQQQYNPHVHEHDPHHGYQQVQHYIPEQHYNNMMPAQNNVFKEEHNSDPYSFIDEAGGVKNDGNPNAPKKRGRKKKVKSEDDSESPTMQTMELFPGGTTNDASDGAKRKYTKSEQYKQRRKHDRFNGMTEEEVRSRTLPDHLAANLDVVIIGINPGLFAAYKGHHYAGPGNHFWKCLYLAGLVPEPMTADDDSKLIHFGIGFTNMVARATKGSADLTRKEIREGGRILLEKLQKFRPKIAVFNGKGIYEVFSGKKEFTFGKQPECIDGTNTFIWVMPSSSARCAQLPRAMDKVPFYAALKKFRDYLNGLIPEIDENEVIFNDPKIRAADDGTEISEHLKVDSVSSEDLPAIGESPEGGQQPEVPVKKKRGRPKKIKTEDGNKETINRQNPQQINELDGGVPKKKRGRPKKVRADPEGEQQQQQQQPMGGPQPGAYLPNQGQFFGGQSWQASDVSPHHSSASSTPLTPAATASPRQPEFDAAAAAGMSMGAAQRVSPAQGSSGSEQQQQHRATPGDHHEPPTHHITSQHPNQQGNVGYHRPTPPGPNAYHNQDVASKSISGLESLVDQIPSLASSGPPAHEAYHQYQTNGYPQQHHQQNQQQGNFASFNHYAPHYNNTGAAPYYHQGMQDGGSYPGYAMPGQQQQQQQTNGGYAPYYSQQYAWNGASNGPSYAPPYPPASGYANEPSGSSYSTYPAYTNQ